MMVVGLLVCHLLVLSTVVAGQERLKPKLNIQPIHPRDTFTPRPAGPKTCDVKLEGNVQHMKYQDIIRVYNSSFLKTKKELGIEGCASKPVCFTETLMGSSLKAATSAMKRGGEKSPDEGDLIRRHSEQCSNPGHIYSCSQTSGGCSRGQSDGGKCCETCQAQLDLTYYTFTHEQHGTVYPIQFPSLGIVQPATIGFCGQKNCNRCEVKTGLHTFLVSTSPIPDTPSGAISVELHTEELPMYCRCVEQ